MQEKDKRKRFEHQQPLFSLVFPRSPRLTCLCLHVCKRVCSRGFCSFFFFIFIFFLSFVRNPRSSSFALWQYECLRARQSHSTHGLIGFSVSFRRGAALLCCGALSFPTASLLHPLGRLSSCHSASLHSSVTLCLVSSLPLLLPPHPLCHFLFHLFGVPSPFRG